jgi:glucose-6-phosphate 1-dehydrogenase
MVQNHLTQIPALTAMEPPGRFDPEAIRNEKAKVLQAAHLANEDEAWKCCVRGQYSAGGTAANPLAGYRQEPGVNANSTTETYVAMKLFINNWRWQGVPFYLRTGKRMPKKVSEIAIQFRDVPLMIFQSVAHQTSPNILSLRIQPNEGISLRFEAKMPGSELRTRTVEMDFNYGSSFGVATADAYHRLLLDAMLGDQTLFTRADEVEEAWRVVTPALAAWDAPADPSSVPQYEAGTWNPSEAEALLNREGHRWRRL